MTHSEQPCTHCAHLSVRQMLLDWAPVIAVIIDCVQWFVR